MIRRLHSLLIACLIACCLSRASPPAAAADDRQELPAINVEGRPYGEEIIGPYNQPRWSARGRFSAGTDVYVLPPFSFYVDLDYHGTFPRTGKPDHLFVQEFELGLPHRFQIAFELYEEAQDGNRQVPFILVEGRYALADWGKIPLNPTLLAEFSLGLGKHYPVEIGGNAESGDKGDKGDAGGQVRRATRRDIEDAYELRLLLGQEFGKYIEFAGNIFFDQGIGADREREMGFSTATSYAIRGEALKIGLETSFQNVSQHGERGKSKNIFELGPAFTVKPSPHTRLDIAPLIGATKDAPHLNLFVIFSIDFGTGASREIESPVSRGARF